VSVKRLALAAATLAIGVGAPVGAVAASSPSFRMSIVHYVRGCHVWKTTSLRGAKTTVTVKRGTRVEIRLSCPMDFDFRQLRGPRLALGNPRTSAGTSRTIVFRKAGTYVLIATNVQSSAEQGLQTLGADNVLSLTVVAR
jgi:hypothetical protein